MRELYNYEYYHNCCGPIAYEEPEHWVAFFGNVADRIVSDLNPKIVLDAGCAMGYLVAALRDRGVEAYGIDFSEYAISNVREDIKPYCIVGSITEPLPLNMPQRYDLVVTIEVLEHLYADDGKKAIQNLCALSDQILFTSTPDDFTEHTHVNVQQREYWARIFAEEGFFDDINYRPTYLTYYASYFKKSENWLRQIEDYERHIRMFEAQQTLERQNYSKLMEDKERHIQNQDVMLADAGQQHQKAIEAYEARLRDSEQARQAAETHYQELLAAAAQEKQDSEERYEEQLAAAARDLLQSEAAYVARLEAAQKELAEAGEEYQRLADSKRRRYIDLLAQKEKRFQRERKQLETAFAQMLEQEKGNAAREMAIVQQQKDIAESEVAHYKEHYFAAINQRNALESELAQVQQAYHVISNAFFWKITKPFRFTLDLLKSVLRKSKHFQLIGKGLRCWKENGFSYTWQKIRNRRYYQRDLANAALLAFRPEELAAQRNTVFPQNIKFSILVPLYNTPERFLHEMIQSVLDQTYANWELCLADGSDSGKNEVEKLCRQYVRRDRRIRYRRLKENLGISGNTNACIEMSSGEYIALFDHDDLLHPAALYEVMRAICEQDADFIYTDENTFHETPADAFFPRFKPDYAPDTLRTINYICHFTVFSRGLLNIVGGFRSEFDGSQDYDMVLRLTEQAHKIAHVPKILYYWRAHANSVADGVGAKPYVISAARAAIREHLQRIGLKGEVMDSLVPSTYRICYEMPEFPLVSIVIPNKDHKADLQKCILSILDRTNYPNWEIVIVENNSTDIETFDYYSEIKKDQRIRVITWNGKFNYSAITNFGVKNARGEYLLLLNNDIEIITHDWIEQMMMFAQREDVGAVGCMLYYPDDTIQHAGVILGIGGVAGHSHKHFRKGEYGYVGRLTIAQNLSAVTAACLLTRRKVWEKINGFDESFEVAFNDVDFCMRIRKAGYLIVWTPYAELYHYESKSRGLEDTPEKRKRFQGEILRFQSRWAKELAAGDPYYNPNLTLNREDFSLK